MQHLIDHDIKDKGEYQLTNAMEHMKQKGARFKAGAVDVWMDCGNKNAMVDTNTKVLGFLTAGRTWSPARANGPMPHHPALLHRRERDHPRFRGGALRERGVRQHHRGKRRGSGRSCGPARVYSKACWTTACWARAPAWRAGHWTSASATTAPSSFSKIRLHLLLVLLLAACSGSRDSGGGPAEAPGGGRRQGQGKRAAARVMALFMEATKARLAGEMGSATQLFEQVLKADPKNDAACFELPSSISTSSAVRRPSPWPARPANWTPATSGTTSCWPT